MPWKGEKDAYRIWLSEIILQQTRVEQGLAYYQRFTQEFPRITDLAAASDDAIMKLWEGLGYYSRCRNLIATARQIARERKGRFPDTYDEIRQLPGIGPYTAAAIASFAYNHPYAVVDGNVYRVLSRVFGIRLPIDSTTGKKYFAQLAQELIDPQHAALYNQAIMDFGATICKPQSPLCDACPFQKNCIAYREGLIAELPVKEKKISTRTRYFNYFLLRKGRDILIRQRIAKDIWQHLYELPLLETNSPANSKEVTRFLVENIGLKKPEFKIDDDPSCFQQQLSHQQIKAAIFTVKLKGSPKTVEGFKWVAPDEIAGLAFPKIIRGYLDKEVLGK